MLNSERHCSCGHLRKQHHTPTEESYDDSCTVKECDCTDYLTQSPVYTTHHVSSKDDGTPTIQTRMATCYECGDWATQVFVSKTTNSTDGYFDPFMTKSEEQVLIRYSCTSHSDLVQNNTCDDGWGSSFNYLDGVFELAQKVDEYATMVHRNKN